MSEKTTPKKKKQRWSETLPTVLIGGLGILPVDAANYLVLALAAEDEDVEDKNVLVDGAAAEIRAFRKSLNVDSERVEVLPYLEPWGGATGDNLLWKALSYLSSAAIWADECSGFPHDRVADVLRAAEAYLREHWKQRPENGAPTETPATTVTVCSIENGCE